METTDFPADMNEGDRKNLQILLNAEPNKLAIWMAIAPIAQVMYAESLLRRHQVYEKSKETAILNMWDNPIADTKEAMEVLSKFRLKKES